MKFKRYNKYKNTICYYDGFCFRSGVERDRYISLKLLEKNGIIKSLTLQPSFILQEKFVKNGVKFGAIKYVADFSYIHEEKKIVEDVKGLLTQVFKINRKLFEKKYPDLTIKLM